MSFFPRDDLSYYLLTCNNQNLFSLHWFLIAGTDYTHLCHFTELNCAGDNNELDVTHPVKIHNGYGTFKNLQHMLAPRIDCYSISILICALIVDWHYSCIMFPTSVDFSCRTCSPGLCMLGIGCKSYSLYAVWRHAKIRHKCNTCIFSQSHLPFTEFEFDAWAESCSSNSTT